MEEPTREIPPQGGRHWILICGGAMLAVIALSGCLCAARIGLRASFEDDQYVARFTLTFGREEYTPYCWLSYWKEAPAGQRLDFHLSDGKPVVTETPEVER